MSTILLLPFPFPPFVHGMVPLPDLIVHPPQRRIVNVPPGVLEVYHRRVVVGTLAKDPEVPYLDLACSLLGVFRGRGVPAFVGVVFGGGQDDGAAPAEDVLRVERAVGFGGQQVREGEGRGAAVY